MVGTKNCAARRLGLNPDSTTRKLYEPRQAGQLLCGSISPSIKWKYNSVIGHSED